MRQVVSRILLLLLVILLACTGCSKEVEKKYVIKGTIMKGGKPLARIPPDAYCQFILYPTDPNDQRTFPGELFKETGTFEVPAIPAGKYLVTLTTGQGKEDLLRGALSHERSKLVIEVTGNKDDMVIDLGK
jgi:hypothetical protein